MTAGRDESFDPTLSAEEAEGVRGPQETAAPGPDAVDSPEPDRDAGPAAATGAEAGEAPEANNVQADLTAAQQAVASLTDDLKRLQAEYVNYKRRVDRDRELVLQNARFTILSALLPVLDDLDRARDHGELEGGFKAVADSLERIVAGQGLEKFGAPGDEFDPRLHEALLHAHSPDVTTTTCQTIVSAGYRIGDRVLRPARVTVVDPEPEQTGTEEVDAEPVDTELVDTGQVDAGQVETGQVDAGQDDAGQDEQTDTQE